MLKIAITGNIASGKSQAEKIIAKNYLVFDADKLAHEVLDSIKDFYGYDVFSNGKIDRQKLAKFVFTDQSIKQKLEALVHPRVKDKILDIFDKFKNEEFIFVSVPLLYEAEFDALFDKVILISADDDIRLNRLMKRNSLTKNEAVLRINSQLSQSEKEKRADYVINNNSTLENLEIQISTCLNDLNK